MRLQATFRHWDNPPRTGGNQTSRFRCGPTKAYQTLADEVRRLGGAAVIIEAGFREDQIRNDGWPYSSARPSHSAVRVSFHSRHGPLSFECGTYKTIDDNLYAIALTMQALREVDRYGAVKGAQQYKGWKQLPGDQPPAKSTSEAELGKAAAFLCELAAEHELSIPRVIARPEILRAIYRRAALKCHPDQGGSPDMMARVNAAKDLIEKHQTAGVA